MEIINAWIAGKTIEVRCFKENVWRVYTCTARNPPVNETLNSCEWRIVMPKIINEPKPVTAVKQPHKHAAIIKAWADGAQIQCKGDPRDRDYWLDTQNPFFNQDYEYRIKPEKKSDGQLMFEAWMPGDGWLWSKLGDKSTYEIVAAKFLTAKAAQE